MKIQCQSCQAKYTIADEKVLGKVVKIRCKKCSSTIVINGNEQAAQGDGGYDYAAQSSEAWTVNVADGDQRTMTGAEIGTEYRAGTINDETYCWKEGMADWLPLREIDELSGSVQYSPRASIEDISVTPQSVPGSALGSGQNPLFSAFAPTEVDKGESPYAGHSNGNGHGANYGEANGETGETAIAAPAAARRGGGRGQGADLFGNVAAAGAEEDVVTSTPPASLGGGGGGAGAAGQTVDDKLTGQRNENSVLFSLSALTEKEAPAPAGRTTAAGDGSGLIDIRALSAMGNEPEKRSSSARVDDIMNLSGGGAFGAALAAPILAPPPLEVADPGAIADSNGKSNKMMFVAILGGAALIAIGLVVAVVLTRPAAPTANTDKSSPTGTMSVAANDTATGNPGVATAAPTNENTPPPPGTGGAAARDVKPAPGGSKPASGGAVAAGGMHNAAGGTTAAASPDPTPPPTPAKPTSLNDALAGAVNKPQSAPAAAGGGSSTAPFDRGAAAAALGAVNVQACKKGDGPTGGGHIQVTFGPDGNVQTAIVDQGPFPGTPVGSCISGKFRGAHVPAFGGAPVRVGKSFTVN